MWCTYLTIYGGNKLPKRYIGSTKIDNIHAGYNGSIKSKKYQRIYENEQRYNKELFKTRILKTFDTQKEAISAELELHKRYDVVRNKNYMNMSLACPNGFFGKITASKDHQFYNKNHTEKTKEKISKSVKKAYAEGRLISRFKTLDVSGKNNPFYGRTHAEETKNKMRKPKKYVPKFKCPHCDKQYDGGNLKQHMIRNGFSLKEIDEWKQKNKPIN